MVARPWFSSFLLQLIPDFSPGSRARISTVFLRQVAKGQDDASYFLLSTFAR